MSTEITIESGIPLPTKKRAPKWTPLFRAMAPGDSFFVEVPPAKLHTTLYIVAKRLKCKITIRAAQQNGRKGARVWLVARNP